MGKSRKEREGGVLGQGEGEGGQSQGWAGRGWQGWDLAIGQIPTLVHEWCKTALGCSNLLGSASPAEAADPLGCCNPHTQQAACSNTS